MAGGTSLPRDSGRTGLLQKTAEIDLGGTEEFGVATLKQGREEHVQIPVGLMTTKKTFRHGIGRIQVGIDGIFCTRISEQQFQGLRRAVQPSRRNPQPLSQTLDNRRSRIDYSGFDRFNRGYVNAGLSG